MSRFYIAGCGRSGTTLMLRLFKNFEGCTVIFKEAPVSLLFETEVNTLHVVTKRNAGAYKVLPETIEVVKIIYMVRSPYDVLTSYHSKDTKRESFYIDPERWVSEFESYKKLVENRSGKGVHVVKYEELINDPDLVQRNISQFCNMAIAKTFSEAESIKASSVEKFKSNDMFRNFLLGLDDSVKASIKEFCEHFGYEYWLG